MRSPRRQHLVTHLYRCGPRPLLEALIAIEAGRPVDDVLEEFARIPADTYHVLGANILPIDELATVDGGRP